MAAYPTIPRIDSEDPHSAIDYAALGSEIEHNYTQRERGAFFRAFEKSTDAHMAALSTFCRFKCEAVGERLAGRIDAAMLAEKNAETVYEREIIPANRW